MALSKDTVIRLSSVDSTNRYLRDEAASLFEKKGADGGFVVVTAEHQTAGRGQRGNVWNSNAGENLLFSVLVRPGDALAVTRQFLLSQAVALALHDAMEYFGIDVRLKWPNDIYVGNRKLAGILVELDYCGAYVEQAIIGIGINVNQECFPPMDRVPVSMKMLQGYGFVLDDVLEKFLRCFGYRYAELCGANADVLSDEYMRLLLGYNERRTFIDANGRFDAFVESVEHSGHLLLRRSDGVLLRYAFKEIEQLL